MPSLLSLLSNNKALAKRKLLENAKQGNHVKNQLKKYFVVLGFNIVVQLLVLLAFILYIFRNDLVLAVIPLIIALPGIVLQSWLILFSLIPGPGYLLSPVLTTAVTVPIYSFLDRKGKLVRLKNVLARLKKGHTRTAIASIFVIFLGVGFARYIAFPPFNNGIPSSMLAHSIKGLDLKLVSPRYYCLGAFLDSEWLWQVQLSETDLNKLVDTLNLHLLDPDKIGKGFQSKPPYWWHPVVSHKTHALATANFPMEGRGRDGWHALATWNPDDELLHMWIKDNF